MITKAGFTIRPNITSLAVLKIDNGRRIELETGERFIVSSTNKGQGVLLSNGNFANPVNDPFTEIDTPTELSVGSKSISTVTNTHTMDDGVNVGDSIDFTWAGGTVATIQADSNITFTNNSGSTTSDTLWVFNYPIVEIKFVWSGSQWEIK